MAIEIRDFGKHTRDRLIKLYQDDQKLLEQIWKTGCPMFDQAIMGLSNGLIMVSAAENVGKSNITLNLGRRILDHTPGSILIDFVLDDSFKKRGRFYVASEGRLAMRDVTLPGRLDKEDPRRIARKKAYETIIQNYDGRMEIIEAADLDGKGADFETMVDYMRGVRAYFGPDTPIWVNIDAFDDPIPPAHIIKAGIDPVLYFSQTLKHLSSELDLVICCTKHQAKGHRGREATTEALRGSGRLPYDAEIILMVYSDVAEKGQAAEIYFQRDDIVDEQGVVSDDKFPILEITFKKNKAEDFKKKIFMYQFPEQYYCEECAPEEQEKYRRAIQELTGAKKS